MGRQKAKRQQPRARGSRFHIGDKPVGMAEMMAEAGAISDAVDDNGRLSYIDRVFGPADIATAMSPDLSIETEPNADPTPVALFEPTKSLIMARPGEPPRDAQVEGAIAFGLRRLSPGFATFELADGWVLHRLTYDQLELRSPDGGVYSRILVDTEDAAWFSAAERHGHVLCLYGPQLGVRVPPETSPEDYTDAARLEERRLGRSRGLTAGALVEFRDSRP
jgi:hypothetical protein